MYLSVGYADGYKAASQTYRKSGIKGLAVLIALVRTNRETSEQYLNGMLDFQAMVLNTRIAR